MFHSFGAFGTDLSESFLSDLFNNTKFLGIIHFLLFSKNVKKINKNKLLMSYVIPVLSANRALSLGVSVAEHGFYNHRQ